MVEGGDGVEEEKERVRDRAVPRVPVRDLLEETHGVVGEIADGAARERRQLGVGDESLAPHDAARAPRAAAPAQASTTPAPLEPRLPVADRPAARRARVPRKV